MTPAAFHHDLAEGPPDAQAHWVKASDGVRLRLGYWPGAHSGSTSGSGKGTVLLLPGRTEYIEKYGRAAQDLKTRGYATLTIDWRGQGLADRLSVDPLLGHVDRFSDYQLDVAALLKAAERLDCPRPYFLIAHSMGGCIGLRALHQGLPVNAAVFSAPMWGLSIATRTLPFAWAYSWATHQTRWGHRFAPGTKLVSYVLCEPFADNTLTTDADMFAYMQRQVSQLDGLNLGGPSLNWLYEALVETRALRATAPPDIPTLTFLGSNERIVDPAPIKTLMKVWQNGELRMVEGSEHEVLMEIPAIRNAFFDAADTLFMENSAPG